MAELWTEPLRCDIAIVGGGIAGLWLLNRLRREGYHTLLIESNRLGGGQTLCSQGIIHSGVKYSLTGTLSGATRAISAMPERWRRCLHAEGELDLSQVEVLAPHQVLFTGAAFSDRLTGFFAGKALRSPVDLLEPVDYPEVLQVPEFAGRVYRLQEPVLAVASLVRALAEPRRECLLHSAYCVQSGDNELTLLAADDRRLSIRAQRLVFTAGTGNEMLSSVPMQRRPLHMVMARGTLPTLYAHGLGTSDKPRLTITTHFDSAGRSVWYLGGQLAEDGVERSRSEQISAAKQELRATLPWFDLSGLVFATIRIDRAEMRRRSGLRPDTPSLIETGSSWVAWPTKLVMAPLLADEILAKLIAVGVRPEGGDEHLPSDWPRPLLGDYPWQRERVWS